MNINDKIHQMESDQWLIDKMLIVFHKTFLTRKAQMQALINLVREYDGMLMAKNTELAEMEARKLEAQSNLREVAMQEIVKYAKLYGYEQAKNDRLRAAIEQAPHAWNCTYVLDSGTIIRYGVAPCNCWKADALRAAGVGEGGRKHKHKRREPGKES